MKKLSNFLFTNQSIEEAMAISGGGAATASSGQISGGPMLPVGMKPGEKVKKRKPGTIISASPAVHDPDALALQEAPWVEYDHYQPKDFKVETLPISPEDKRKIMVAFRNKGVLCHGPNGEVLVCTLDGVHKATEEEMHDPDMPKLEVTLEDDNDGISESFGAMHKPDFKGPAMPGLWKGLENPTTPVKTDSPALHKKKKKKTS